MILSKNSNEDFKHYLSREQTLINNSQGNSQDHLGQSPVEPSNTSEVNKYSSSPELPKINEVSASGSDSKKQLALRTLRDPISTPRSKPTLWMLMLLIALRSSRRRASISWTTLLKSARCNATLPRCALLVVSTNTLAISS